MSLVKRIKLSKQEDIRLSIIVLYEDYWVHHVQLPGHTESISRFYSLDNTDRDSMYKQFLNQGFEVSEI